MEKDLNPYEFTLEIEGEPQAIRVEVPKAGDYIVYINGERSGHIYPQATTGTLVWIAEDEMDQALVNQIGQQIEIMEKGTSEDA